MHRTQMQQQQSIPLSSLAQMDCRSWRLQRYDQRARLKTDLLEDYCARSAASRACPGFQATWQAHLDWWKGDEPGAYNDTAEFARYLVESFENGQTSEFPTAFATIERILNEGDQESLDIALIGVCCGR